MKVYKLALILLLGSTACTAEYTNYFFSGRVYNGAAGSRLTDYEIELQFLDQRVEGQVDEDGRYFVGPLSPFNDYTIAIRAEGYRSFLSHNIMKLDDDLTFNNEPTDDTDHPDRSQYFDAYLYPTDVVAPAATFNITLSDSPDAPSGTIRLRPAGAADLFAGATPAGVGGQMWINDDDLQFGAVTKHFSGGIVNFAEGELIYGVTYVVTIFGVDGHATTTALFTAGIDQDPSFVVNIQNKAALALSFVSTQLGQPVASGELIFIFDRPVIFDPLTSVDDQLKSLEANFSIDSPDKNGDTVINDLKPFDPMMPAGSRGLSMTLAGNKLTLAWSPAVALMTTDNADPIKSVTYGGLGGVVLRPVDGQAADAVSLATLLGAASMLVPVTP